MLKHLQPLPISEEMLGAYLEGNLSVEEVGYVESGIGEDDMLRGLVDEIDDVQEDWTDMHRNDFDLVFEQEIEDFILPEIDFDIINSLELMNSEMNSDYNVSFGQLTPDDIHQRYPDTCAIKSQQIILESVGIEISEDELLAESIEKGLYIPGQGGTAMPDVGVLMEDHGMIVDRFINASIDDLALELAHGHHIIVGVDSGELWEPGRWENFEDYLGHLVDTGGADHALIVSGIQVNPLTAEREVILTDPGTGEIAHVYTVEQFLDAWDDSSNFMVIAE